MNRNIAKLISVLFFVLLLPIYNALAADSPVERAVKDGNFELVKSMLEGGANANAAGDHTPLYWAVRGKKLDLVKLLLKHNADINMWREPLVAAMKFKADDIAEYILNQTNIRVNDRVDYMGENTYLYHAIINKNHKIMLMLLEKGASVIDNGSPFTRGVSEERADEARNRLLSVAVKEGDPIAVRLLLEFGADPNKMFYKMDFGDVLLKTGDPKVVEAFIRKGLDVKKHSKYDGKTVLHYAVDAAVNGKSFNKDAIKMLVNAGADTNAKDKNNLTPAIYAMTLPKSKARDDVVAYLKKS